MFQGPDRDPFMDFRFCVYAHTHCVRLASLVELGFGYWHCVSVYMPYSYASHISFITSVRYWWLLNLFQLSRIFQRCTSELREPLYYSSLFIRVSITAHCRRSSRQCVCTALESGTQPYILRLAHSCGFNSKPSMEPLLELYLILVACE